MLDPTMMLDGLGEPMLADVCEANLATLVGTHAFDQKLDGVRALLGTSRSGFALRNRSGRDIVANFPEMEAGATFALRDGLVLDGEITAKEGTFQDINRRGRVLRPGANGWLDAKDHPAEYTAFDILHHPKEGDVRHWAYQDRRALLDSIGLNGHGFTTSIVSADPAHYERIKALGGEGVVAKRLTSRYHKGRKKDWLKFKTTREITAIAVGYEAGRGSRADCGAFLLVMIDVDGKPVHVGKVGGGMTRRQINEIKGLIDQRETPVLEVTVLGRSRDNILRQPTFKGLRTDLDVHEVNINQLNALPRG